MPDDWTAVVAEMKGRMFVAKITNRALAKESGYNEAYVSEILNGRRGTDDSREKLLAALGRLEEKQLAARA